MAMLRKDYLIQATPLQQTALLKSVYVLSKTSYIQMTKNEENIEI